MDGGDYGEEISETEETLMNQDGAMPQGGQTDADLDEMLRRANKEAEDRVKRLASKNK